MFEPRTVTPGYCNPMASPSGPRRGSPAWTGEARSVSRNPNRQPPHQLTDAEWATIGPLVAPAVTRGRRHTTDLPAVVAAIRHHWQTGCPWRNLPADYPPWQTVYTYFRKWRKDGTLRRLREVVGVNPPSMSISQHWPVQSSVTASRPDTSPATGAG